jgi:hypothetical protein
VGQRIFGLALGYEGINDHGELGKHPTLAALVGKLSPVPRTDCATFAGKGTLIRPEHMPRRHALLAGSLDLQQGIGAVSAITTCVRERE